MAIDLDDYLKYRCSGSFTVYQNRTIPQPLVSKPSRRSPGEEFDKGIKLDPPSYPTLSNDKQLDNQPHELQLQYITKDQGTAKHLATCHGQRPTVDESTSLLESPAQNDDATQCSKPSSSKSTRRAYVTDVVSSDLESDPELGIEFNIDTDPGTL